MTEALERDAIISDCGLYRYELRRWWDKQIVALPFVMLNPSTADAEVDDPTIRRCIGFARREGFGGLVVLNLFALRATDPAELRRVRDPVGPENNAHLKGLFEECAALGTPIIAAWGVLGKLNERAARVKRLALESGVTLHCLGKSKDGHPKHPLYLPGDAAIIPLDETRRAAA